MSDAPVEFAVLVADDSQFSRQTLIKELKRIGFREFLEAEDVKEALGILEKKPVGLIISDQRMPGMTGTSFLHKVRRTPQWERIPFILCTAHVDKNVVAECADYGGDALMLKPFSAGLLEDKINEAFRERALALGGPEVMGPKFLQIKNEDFAGPTVVAMQAKLSENNPKVFLAQGRKAEDEGDKEKAEDFYKKALGPQQNFIKAHEALIRLYLKGGREDLALEHLERAVELSPANFQRRYELAVLYSRQGRAGEALASLDKMLEDGCNYPDLLCRVAKLYQNHSRINDAEKSLGLAIEAHPSHRAAYDMLIDMYLKRGDNQEASNIMAKALHRNPEDRDLHYMYAKTLAKAHHLDLAKAETMKLLERDPDHAEAKALMKKLG